MNQDERRINAVSELLEEFGYDLFNDYNNFGLFSLLLTKKNKAFLFLEMYSVSLSSLISEVIAIKNMSSVSFIKFIYRFIYFTTKLLLFKIFIKNNSLIIVPSKLRKKYLEDVGYTNVVVVKNKPLEPIEASTKKNTIILSGNLRSLNAFDKFYNEFFDTVDLDVIGVNGSTKNFLLNNYPNVKINDYVENKDLIKKLSESKYALISYDGYSTNQILSASSKLFEIYNASCLPIINNNPGLLFECIDESTPFIVYDNQNDNFSIEASLNQYNKLVPEQKLFSDELKKLRCYLSEDSN